MFFKCDCGILVHLNTKNEIKNVNKICFLCWKNSFVSWFFREYQYKWESSYTELSSFSHEACEKYELWCKEQDIKPIWNG